MNNFLQFIEEDVNAKKTLISSLPTKTKSNIKKYNEKIVDIIKKYKLYKDSVKKYLDVKSKSFNIKSDKKELEKIHEDIKKLEEVRFILNPLNTCFEKMGFDNLIYQISNYVDFNFSSLNDIITEFLDKFEEAGIILDQNEFNYTSYVNEYMGTFLEARKEKKNNYEKVSDTFEKIYWQNPDIIEHIELNFRKIFRKYEKGLNTYIAKKQEEICSINKVSDYKDCLLKLEDLYKKYNILNKENVSDIMKMAKEGSIDINGYFENSKVRVSTFNEMAIEAISFEDKEELNKFYDSLNKLRLNVEELINYIKFLPVIDNFKKEYSKQIPTDNKAISNNNLKTVMAKIIEKESKLDKINKIVLSNRQGLFGNISDKQSKKLKLDSVRLAKELYSLYKEYDQEYFKDKVSVVLSDSLTVSELLNLYYSFSFFKKQIIKKSFELNGYEDIIKYSDEFDLFAMNLNNLVINGMLLFEAADILRVIMNRYRLYNINLNDDNFTSDDLDTMLNKIKFLLRINEIESNQIPIDKIWFMVQVEKINIKEQKASK